MALQSVPAVALAHGTEVRREGAAAVAASRRLWGRIGDDFDAGFLAIAPQLLEVMGTAQVRVAAETSRYVPEVLSATGQGRADRPNYQVSGTAMLGTAGDGRPTESLAYGAVTTAKTAVGQGASVAEAKARGGQFLAMAVSTLVADTARSTELLELSGRPIAGYVRMLNPPSCGRCVILAGKRYKTSQAFLRHPMCDCVHIPASESLAGDWTTSPAGYLDSLDDDVLAKALGSQANAEAYRDFGADPFQLINAYRRPGGARGPGGIPSIFPAQIPRRVIGADGRVLIEQITVKATLEGTTVRGYAGQQMASVRQLTAEKLPGQRYRRVTAPRLMPESILGLGLPKDRTARLLRDHGWI